MLKKLLFLGAFLLPTLGMAASDTDLSEPESSSAIESTESGGYYGDYRRGPGCDDDYRRVYPPRHPPRYPAPYPPRYPNQNPKKLCKQFKKDFYGCTRDPRARSACYWDYNDNKCRPAAKRTRCSRIRNPRSCEQRRGCFYDFRFRSCRDRR